LEGGIHPDAGQLLSRAKTTPYSEFFLYFGVENVSVWTSPSSLPLPLASEDPDDGIWSHLRVELKMGSCECFEQWTGVLSKISLNGGVKRKIAREIVQRMVQMGKGYEEAQKLVKGMDQFTPESDTLQLSGTRRGFSLADLGSVYHVLSGNMVFEQTDFEIIGQKSFGKYRRLTLKSTSCECLERFRAGLLARISSSSSSSSSSSQYEMSLPKFVHEVVAPQIEKPKKGENETDQKDKRINKKI